MNINKKCEGGTLTILFEGDFLVDCVPEAEVFFRENLAPAVSGIDRVEVDLGGVKRLAKEGLLLLLATKKKLDGKAGMALVNVGEELYDKLEEQGVTTLLDVRRKEE